MSDIRSEEQKIEAIFEAADAFWNGKTDERERDRKLSDAIDEFGAHAFGEGYDQCLRDMREKELEKACRAMNETGQGEHGGLVGEIEKIWGLPKRVA